MRRYAGWGSRCGVALALLVAAGCVSIPKEAPLLSAELGGRIQQTRGLHQRLVRVYMDERRAAVDRFLISEWLPEFGRAFVTNPKIAEAWTRAAGDDVPARVEFISRISPPVQAALAAKRAELVRPLDEIETAAVRRLEDHYNEMLAMNAALTGLLSAEAKLTETEDRIRTALKVKGDLEPFLDKADEVVSLATSGLGAFEKNKGRIDEIVQQAAGTR